LQSPDVISSAAKNLGVRDARFLLASLVEMTGRAALVEMTEGAPPLPLGEGWGEGIIATLI